MSTPVPVEDRSGLLLCREMRTALANSPDPLNAVVYVQVPDSWSGKIIGIVEQHNVTNLVKSVPPEYTVFVLTDGKLLKGNKDSRWC